MISQESIKYWQDYRKNCPQLGTPVNPFILANLRAGMGTRQEPADKNVKLTKVMVDNVPCEWVMAPGADPDVRLLYFHGGGYVCGSGGNYLPLAADLSAAAKCAVLLPDYRLAPEHRFPAGLEDSLRAYEWMLVAGPNGKGPARATFIAGDSAGGGMTLATLLALRDRKRPLPRAGIPLSAYADLSLASESIKSQAETELFMSPSFLVDCVNYYVDPSEVHNPLVSPVFGDYTGIPPLLFQVGEYEIIRDDSIRAAAKAKADGVDVTLEVWPGQVHVFHIRGLPESREAIQRIAKFMQSHL